MSLGSVTERAPILANVPSCLFEKVGKFELGFGQVPSQLEARMIQIWSPLDGTSRKITYDASE